MSTQTETCTVRPELIEFDKTGDHYFTIVAHPEGFKFMETGTATNEAGNISEDLSYDTSNLADLFANNMHVEQLFVSNISDVETLSMLDGDSVIQMNSADISNVGTFTTDAVDPITIHSNVIDMNNTGSMTNTGTISFWEQGATTSLTMQNDLIVFGEADGLLDMTDGDIANVMNLKLSSGGLGVIDAVDGNIINVGLQQMSALGVIEFPAGGVLEMTSTDCAANIGDLQIKTNEIINVNDTVNGVNVELTNFLGNVISTATINALDSTTLKVFDATFTAGNVMVNTVRTDEIQAIGNIDDPTEAADLSLKAIGDGTISVNNHRITNVGWPANDTDAANKGYVKEAVSTNIQGLKPKKACDYGIFADQWSLSNVDRDRSFMAADTSTTDANWDPHYFITHKWGYDANVGDTSVMTIYFTVPRDALSTTVGNVSFGGAEVPSANVFFNEAYLSELDPLRGCLPRKRILINGLSDTVYTPNNTAPGISTMPDLMMGADVNVAGLNGIWDVVRYHETIDVGSTNFSAIELVRAGDMNEDKEIMNNAYTYLMNGTGRNGNQAMGNFGYVVNNGDPITVSKTTGFTEAPVDKDIPDGALELAAVEWVEFNQVNYELDFVNTNNERLEDGVTTEFGRGALLMRVDESQASEKQIMADWNMLNYDVSGNNLNVLGDVVLTPKDPTSNVSSISVDGNDSVLNLNGAKVTGGDTSTLFEVDDIIANTVTCESDKSLKKNIAALMNGVGMVDKLKPVTYNWIKDNACEQPEYGFIAQDVQEVFPSLVHTNETSGILSVDYMKFTSILASAVQELAQEVKDLKAKMM